MPGADWLFDGVLALLVIILAIACLHTRGLFTAAVLFITFGLVLAVTWARLGAPDLALAEAAIGAGLTGALLLSSLPALARDNDRQPPLTWNLGSGILLGVLLAVLLVRALAPTATQPPVLPGMAMAALADSGVSHPVTAVLLNFRAWDTLLELVVVLLALLAVRQLPLPVFRVTKPWPLLAAWGRILAPLTVLVGGYLLWRGSSAPGGAFQAGALLAAGAVVLRLSHCLPPLGWHQWWLRALILLGTGVFLALAAAFHWLGDGWLHYPAPWSGPLIIVIEVAATLSIAATLTLLVVGEREEPES